MTLRVACLGEAMVELSFDQATPSKAALAFAGDTLNTGIYLKRNAPGLQVGMASRVGVDAFSVKLLAFVRSEGISTELVGTSDTRNVGLYAIDTDDAGERSFTYWRDTSAAREALDQTPPSLQQLATWDVLYLSAISLAVLGDQARAHLIDWLPEYRGAGGRVAFDSNYRPKLWADPETARAAVEAVWRQTDIALPSVDDEMAIFRDGSTDAVVRRLAEFGVTDGALKCGPGGPVSLGEAVAQDYPPAPKVVDTTAAGDSFNGGYLAVRLTGGDQASALRAGHDQAVRVLACPGAILPR